MQEDIITTLITDLQNQGKMSLAGAIDRCRDMSVKEYSEMLWKYHPEMLMEDALKQAFQKEFERVGVPENEQKEILASLEKYRTIQTAPHTGIHDTSRMLVMNWVATRGIPSDASYVVASFSGIPFANDSYPAALSFSKDHSFEEIFQNGSSAIRDAVKKQEDRMRDIPEDGYNRLSLYPSRNRDMIVYRSEIPDTYRTMYPEFSDVIKRYLPNPAQNPDREISFTKIMTMSDRALLQKSLPNVKLATIDINEVISTYFQAVLTNPSHFIYKMFFDPTVHQKMLEVFTTDEHFFYHTDQHGKEESQHHAYIENFLLKSKDFEKAITPEELIVLLHDTKLCPGVFIGFTVLSFLNGFQCFGSFKQTQYLSKYKKMWQDSGMLPHDISNVPTDSLTTGEIPDTTLRTLTPIDIALGSEWKPNEDYLCRDLVEPIIPLLLAFKN